MPKSDWERITFVLLEYISGIYMGHWDKIECEAIVQNYMAMLYLEIREEIYSKAEHRRALQPLLNNRSEPSIEYKHRNISAALLDFSFIYIPGYKPAYHSQGLLREVVEKYLFSHEDESDRLVSRFIEQVPDSAEQHKWDAVLSDAPLVDREKEHSQIREFQPRKYDFSNREAQNKKLGNMGEKFVLEYEKYRLDTAGRGDLAKEVEWISEQRGDGAGYDIRSFDHEKEEELFIEVKTTNSGKYQPFFVTDNELAFSLQYASKYSLYRVFQFKRDPKIFTMDGRLADHVNLASKLYQASF